MSNFLNTLSTMEAESLFAWLTVITFILFGVVGMSRLIEYACDLYGRLATMRDHNLTKPQPPCNGPAKKEESLIDELYRMRENRE